MQNKLEAAQHRQHLSSLPQFPKPREMDCEGRTSVKSNPEKEFIVHCQAPSDPRKSFYIMCIVWLDYMNTEPENSFIKFANM